MLIKSRPVFKDLLGDSRPHPQTAELSRRDFLCRGMTLGAGTLALPSLLGQAVAHAAMAQVTCPTAKPSRNVSFSQLDFGGGHNFFRSLWGHDRAGKKMDVEARNPDGIKPSTWSTDDALVPGLHFIKQDELYAGGMDLDGRALYGLKIDDLNPFSTAGVDAKLLTQAWRHVVAGTTLHLQTGDDGSRASRPGSVAKLIQALNGAEFGFSAGGGIYGLNWDGTPNTDPLAPLSLPLLVNVFSPLYALPPNGRRAVLDSAKAFFERRTQQMKLKRSNRDFFRDRLFCSLDEILKKKLGDTDYTKRLFDPHEQEDDPFLKQVFPLGVKKLSESQRMQIGCYYAAACGRIASASTYSEGMDHHQDPSYRTGKWVVPLGAESILSWVLAHYAAFLRYRAGQGGCAGAVLALTTNGSCSFDSLASAPSPVGDLGQRTQWACLVGMADPSRYHPVLQPLGYLEGEAASRETVIGKLDEKGGLLAAAQLWWHLCMGFDQTLTQKMFNDAVQVPGGLSTPEVVLPGLRMLKT